MSNVKPVHRRKVSVPKRSKQEYFQAVELFQDTLLDLIADKIYSLILCGSLVKDTLTPGWSDIDIVVVIKTDELGNINSLIYKAIAQCVDQVDKEYGIPIGIDLITTDELPGKSVLPKILGRPVNLTYQMLRFSKTLYGKEIIENLSNKNTYLTILEEYISILSCVHTYRRICCQRPANTADSSYLLITIQSGIKTLFKIVESLSNFFDGQLVGYSNLVLNLKDFLPNDLLNRLSFFANVIENFQDLADYDESKLEDILDELSLTIDLILCFSRSAFEDNVKLISEYLNELE